jgi:hypothetical protein
MFTFTHNVQSWTFLGIRGDNPILIWSRLICLPPFPISSTIFHQFCILLCPISIASVSVASPLGDLSGIHMQPHTKRLITNVLIFAWLQVDRCAFPQTKMCSQASRHGHTELTICCGLCYSCMLHTDGAWAHGNSLTRTYGIATDYNSFFFTNSASIV